MASMAKGMLCKQRWQQSMMMPSSQCLLFQVILPLHICCQSQQSQSAPDLISAKTIAQNQLCFFLHETDQETIMQVS